MKQEFKSSEIVPWKCHICGMKAGGEPSISQVLFSTPRICDICKQVVCRIHSTKREGKIFCDNCR